MSTQMDAAGQRQGHPNYQIGDFVHGRGQFMPCSFDDANLANRIEAVALGSIRESGFRQDSNGNASEYEAYEIGDITVYQGPDEVRVAEPVRQEVVAQQQVVVRSPNSLVKKVALFAGIVIVACAAYAAYHYSQ